MVVVRLFVNILPISLLFPTFLQFPTFTWSAAVQASNSSEPDKLFEDCSASMQEEAHVNLKQWRCKPRDQIVKLKIPNATYARMIPTHVRIQKCGGSCTSSL